MATNAIRKRIAETRKNTLFMCTYKGCGWISDHNSRYCLDHDRRHRHETDTSRRPMPRYKTPPLIFNTANLPGRSLLFSSRTDQDG